MVMGNFRSHNLECKSSASEETSDNARQQNFDDESVSLIHGEVENNELNSQKPEDLFQYGYFENNGCEDPVICFHCGLGQKDWANGDKPLEEHASWNSRCPCPQLLMQKNCSDFIPHTLSVRLGKSAFCFCAPDIFRNTYCKFEQQGREEGFLESEEPEYKGWNEKFPLLKNLLGVQNIQVGREFLVVFFNKISKTSIGANVFQVNLNNLCLHCNANTVTSRNEPCGHENLCNECKINTCPTCNQEIENHVPIIIAELEPWCVH